MKEILLLLSCCTINKISIHFSYKILNLALCVLLIGSCVPVVYIEDQREPPKHQQIKMNFYFPGDRICASNSKTTSGYGTYERNGYIYASLAGFVKKTETEENVRET